MTRCLVTCISNRTYTLF